MFKALKVMIAPTIELPTKSGIKRGKSMDINVKDINVDTYQRDQLKDKIAAMAKNWNWAHFQPISVSLRPDGTYYCVDGLQRLCSLKEFGETYIECYVVEMDDRKVEAEAFVSIAKGRTRQKPIDELTAMVIAESPGQVFLNNLLGSYGVTITGGNTTVGTCNAIKTLTNKLNTAKKLPKGMLDVSDTIEILHKAWGDQKMAFSGRTVESMMRVVTRINDESRKLLIKEADKRLGEHLIRDLLDTAQRVAKAKDGNINAELTALFIETFNGNKKFKRRIA